MRCRAVRGLIALMMVSCGAAQHPAADSALSLHQFKLANGMTAVLAPDPDATVATMAVRFRVGAVDDPAHEEGLSHLAAHLTYDQRHAGESLGAALDRLTIETVVEHSPTDTYLLARFAPENLDAVLALEARRIEHACEGINDAAFAAERANVAAELVTHPSWRLNQIVNEAIYPVGDPMRRAYDADLDTIRAIPRVAACTFIARRYAPGNATLVVTGPIDPARFERALAPLAGLPARAFDPPATMHGHAAGAPRVHVAADVPGPTLAVAFPLPADVEEQTRALILLDHVASVLGSGEFNDGQYLVVWLPLGSETADAKLSRLATVLHGSVDALGARFARRRTGGWPVLDQTDFQRDPVESFDRTRDRQLSQELAGLDNAYARVIADANGSDLERRMTAIAQLDEQTLRRTLDASLDLARARVLLLDPDASRPMTRYTGLVEPIDVAHRPFAPDAGRPELDMRTPPSVLARATTLRLANGLTVVLAPSSSIPVVHVRLVFAAGTAAAPLHATARTAIAALASELRHGSRPRGAPPRWTATPDSVGFSMSGMTTDLDSILGWLGGLSRASSGFGGAAARTLGSAHPKATAGEASTQRDDAFRAHIYGTHGYGAPHGDATGVPTLEDVEQFAGQFLEPSTATLIVTGQFDPGAATRAIQRDFAPWTGTGAAPTLSPPARGPGAALAIFETSPWVEVHLGWLGGPPDGTLATRQIIAEMIDHLQRRARAEYVSHRFGGHYQIHGVFDPATATAEVAALRDGIASLADGSVASKQLFAVARRAVAMRAAAGPLSSGAWAEELVHTVELGKDLAWRQQFADRAMRVTYDDVKRVLVDELRPGNATWLVAGPEDAVRSVYSALGLAPTAL